MSALITGIGHGMSSNDEPNDEPLEVTDEPLEAKEAHLRVGRDEVDVIDVRDLEAFADGHIPGARHLAEDEVESLKDQLPDDKPALLVCESGERSAELAAKLRDEGQNATSIDGGMESWTSDKLPVQPASDFEFEGPGNQPPGQ